MSIDKKQRATLIITGFFVVVGTILTFGLSTYIFLTIERKPVTPVAFFPANIIASIKTNPKHGMFFMSILLLVIMGVVILLVNMGDKNNFASELDVITDKISTPKKVGQLQHGSAKWLEKGEYIKAFEKYTLDKRNVDYSKMLINGQLDINYVSYLKSEIATETQALLKANVSEETAKSQARTKIIDRERKMDNPILNLTINQIYLKKIEEEETEEREKVERFQNPFKRPPKNYNLNKKGGLVVHYQKKNKHEEYIFCLEDDVHSLILGATGSSKTRSLILQSVCLLGLTGESMVINDPKGEILDYTKKFLEQLGYEVVTLNFREPLLSQRYNFLQPVINAIQNNDIPTAVDLVWDITASLVGETKGERIWHDGEASVIAGSIMSVVYDNKASPQFQNFTNVYAFINYMCRSKGEGDMPLNTYTKELPDKHPAKSLFGVAEIAPSKTRGSFFTSALATLRLFTNPNIYGMTNASDFILEETGNRKRAIYIVLPDEKTTFYSLASLFVYQHYVALVENADKKGGRLDIRTNFILDEYGNFARIPAFDNMLTVSRGRGIRFNLVIQSFAQIEDKYSKEIAETVKDNCSCLIFLKSINPNTTADISKRLGDYTTSSFSRSASASNYNSNNSNSMNLISRPLLKTEEILKIDRPYALVMYSGFDPAMTTLPDLSKWDFNNVLGMGDKEHNTLLRMIRKDGQKPRTVGDIQLWGIWNDKKYLSKGELKKLAEKEALLKIQRVQTAMNCQHEGGATDETDENDEPYHYDV